MKILVIFIFFVSTQVAAQPDSAWSGILATVPEIGIKDSLQVTTESWTVQRLDSTDVKKWFRPLLGSGMNNRLRNRSYFIAGKISSNPVYDLLFILEEKRKGDSVENKVLHFLTTKKSGNYISDVEVAVTGSKKRSTYETVTTLYPGLRFRKSTTIIAGETNYSENSVYQVNNTGRFILSIND